MHADSDSVSLAARLRAGTRDLHGRAERTGVMRPLLRGTLERDRYCLLLRNLHAIYAALEHCLDQHARHAGLVLIHDRALHRAAALRADLVHLHGSRWESELALAVHARDYAGHLHHLSDRDPLHLAAHAYVRYLGDLNGGQMLARIVQRSLQLHDDNGTAFYRFTTEAPSVLEPRLRSGLDALALSADDRDTIVDEARQAFIRHCDLFEELSAMAIQSRSRV